MQASDSENSKRKGARGEAIARAHIERLGMRVVAANYRCSAGEMDLIAEERTAEGLTLVFIEVKTRHGHAHGSPMESVDTRKQQRLANVAQHYLGERGAGGAEPNCRFDVAAVRTDADGLFSVTLHRGVFGAG